MKIENIINELTSRLGPRFNPVINVPGSVITDLVTDSRNHFNPATTLFFAIRNEGGNDGHKFMQQMYERGVRNFVCEYIPQDFSGLKDSNLLVLPSSIEAIAFIGGLNRHRSKEIIAITGSRGKTTLKETLFQLMEPLKKISRSPRSYNSKIGVPLSLWQISPDSDLAIIEAGISRKGEMSHLSETIRPATVIFTKIGDAHQQGFSSLQEKAFEKSLLASGENTKKVIYSLDDELIVSAISNLPESIERISWSQKDVSSDVFVNRTEEGIQFKWKNQFYEINSVIENDYDIENIALAISFMLSENISPEEIIKRFETLQRINTRMNVSEGLNGCSVILDAYTSDISSLLPALNFIERRKMPWQNETLILSELHHEGNTLDATYNEVANLIKESKINRFIGIGNGFKPYANKFPTGSQFYDNTSEFLKNISASDFNNEIILLKGSPEFHFHKIFQLLEAKKHETVLEVNLDALLRNYNYFRSRIPAETGIIAMVKASGYGAGSYEIAKTLQDAGAAYLAVAALDEGIDLRKNGITMPIMIMNPKAANYQSLFNYRLQPVIYSLQMLLTFIREAQRIDLGEYPIHIKLDTGMHRMGFLGSELDELLELLKTSTNIKVASIFSHLATADCLDMDDFTLRQLQRFEDMSNKIIKSLGYPIKRHILNSAGILRFPQYHYDMVRLGIGLYGANTLPPSIEKPLSVVSTLRSIIICIREIDGDQDDAVGYSRKGKITGRRKIATVPIGYADGMNRKFGNGAVKVFLNGKYAPTIGNICMDAMMIDVTGIDCREGDSVEIFGENVSLQNLADTLDTIPYEILTSVSPRVKRIYYRE
ncbi:MAG: bifunctional UDP-N-acetylmuramoyl-tripeptide:D-alanyl-D-alanine ligase/alanine racemase [Muribaculaceae bacterium]|nr:bifunctional UDP-N-acetylmuramoyl-tripeptide:D-alanyl-D-alanine ligase/alanine racemase [Muribaculaceae bacterium]